MGFKQHGIEINQYIQEQKNKNVPIFIILLHVVLGATKEGVPTFVLVLRATLGLSAVISWCFGHIILGIILYIVYLLSLKY